MKGKVTLTGYKMTVRTLSSHQKWNEKLIFVLIDFLCTTALETQLNTWISDALLSIITAHSV